MLLELFATGAPELKPADLEACESTPPSSFCSAHHEAAAASCGHRDDACGLCTAADDVAVLFVLLRRTIAALPSLSPCHSPPWPLKFYLICRKMLLFFFNGYLRSGHTHNRSNCSDALVTGQENWQAALALRTKPELQEEIMSLTGLGRNLYLRAIMDTKYGRRFIIISFYLCLYRVILLSTCCPIFFVLWDDFQSSFQT